MNEINEIEKENVKLIDKIVKGIIRDNIKMNIGVLGSLVKLMYNSAPEKEVDAIFEKYDKDK